jgi:hypothetical protein
MRASSAAVGALLLFCAISAPALTGDGGRPCPRADGPVYPRWATYVDGSEVTWSVQHVYDCDGAVICDVVSNVQRWCGAYGCQAVADNWTPQGCEAP